MSRTLDTLTLDNAARDWAGAFLQPTVHSLADSGRAINGRDWCMENLFNGLYSDVHDYMVAAVKSYLGPKALEEFNADAKERFTPRDPKVHAKLLAKNLAIDIDGDHIEGKIGTVQHGNRVVGKWVKTFQGRSGRDYTAVRNSYWHVYAGEGEEGAADRVKSAVGADEPGADPLPEGAEPLPVGALNTRISSVCAVLACDAVVDELDTGAGVAVLEGRSGGQPADPDTAVTGTLLFTLGYPATAFGAAADTTGDATASAGTIVDDTSADATATVGYCRVSETTNGADPTDDHIDGEAGTSGADFNFNTVAIVAGATVSMTSHDVVMPEL